MVVCSCPPARLATREHRQLCQLWRAQGGPRGGCWETEAQSKVASACSPCPSQLRDSQDTEVLQESQSLLPRVPAPRYVATPLAALLNVKEKTRLRAAPNPTLEHFYLSNGKHPKQVGAAAPLLWVWLSLVETGGDGRGQEGRVRQWC